MTQLTYPSSNKSAPPPQGVTRRLWQTVTGFLGDLSIASKLNLGFGLLVALALLMVTLSLMAGRGTTEKISNTADLRIPMTLVAARSQAALLKMLSAMRSYLILDESQIISEYNQAKLDFETNLAELKRLLVIEGEADDFETISQFETDYEAWSALPEQLFTLHNEPLKNQPALRLARQDIPEPSRIILERIDLMIALQKGRPGVSELLTQMIDFRVSFQTMNTNLQAYASTGDRIFKSNYSTQSVLNAKTWKNLVDSRTRLSSEQQTALDEIDLARQRFLNLVSQIFIEAESERVYEDLYLYKNQAIPQAEKLSAILDEITTNEQAQLQEETGQIRQNLAYTQAQILTGGILALILGITLALIFGKNIAGPVRHLTGVAEKVSIGDLTAQAQVESGDEIGRLAISFNKMTSQLRETITSLDKQRQQLEIVVDITQSLTGILNFSDLLHQTVTLVKETFDFYHVHIYLLDETGKDLVLAEGYGEAGSEMKRRGHHILLDSPKSLVAMAARSSEPVQVDDVRTDEEWLPNPLLPDTHSEVAVPIKLGTQVVGVMDVQSSQAAGFDAQDIAIITTVANQIAVALQNARRFEETSQALAEAEKLQQRYVQTKWQAYLSAQSKTSTYQQSRSDAPPIETGLLDRVKQELNQGQMVVISRGGSNRGETDRAQSAIAAPLSIRGQVIGSLRIHETAEERRWTPEEIALIKTVSEQMSLTLENARLFDDTQRQAARERLTREITDKMRAAPEMDRIIQIGITELANVLGVPRVYVKLTSKLNRTDKDLGGNDEADSAPAESSEA